MALDPGDVADRLAARIEELRGASGQLYVIRDITALNVQEAIRRHSNKYHDGDPTTAYAADDEWCEHQIKRIQGWPFNRVVVTQANRNRAWELRRQLSTSDAIHVAVTESLMGERQGNALLASLDVELVNAAIGTARIEFALPG